MHTLLALFSLALAAAVFAWEGLCCLRAGDFRAELSRRFSCEHALFGDFCWPQRQKLAGPLYFAALFVLLFGRIFLHASKLYQIFPVWYDWLYCLYPLSYLLLTFKIFICTRYNLRQMLLSLAFFLLTVIGCLSFFDENYFALMGFVLAFKDISWKRTLAWYAVLSALIVAILAALPFITPVSMWYCNVPGYRLELGFENPNHLSRVLFTIATACLLLLPLKKRRAAALCIIFPIFLFVNRFPRTRSVCLALIVLSVLVVLYPLAVKLFEMRPIRALLTVCPVLLSAAGIFLAVGYDPSNPVWEKIAVFSNGRLQCWRMAAQAYDPRLLGQEIFYSAKMGELVAIDNSFLELLYAGGILLFVVFLVALCFLLHRVLQQRRYWILCILLSWIAYSFFEAFFFRPFSNFMLLLFAPLLFGQPFPEDGTPSKTT